MMDQCPKCCRRFGLVPAEIVEVGVFLQCKRPWGCGAVFIVTRNPPGPDFDMRLATEAEMQAERERQRVTATP